MKRIPLFVLAASLAVPALAARPAEQPVEKPNVVRPISERFVSADVAEVPEFRQHIVPLLGKLGCNGRACHGSFQGQGGFRLSLFGYDFAMDHEGLLGEGDMGEPRTKPGHPAESLVIRKPTLEEHHDGGRRYNTGSWEHHVLLRWIEGGAKSIDEETPEFVRVDVSPSEIVFSSAGQTQPLRAIAVWSDGTREDVTDLCRFQSNNDQVAAINGKGLVTGGEPGDTHVVVFYDNGVVPIPVIRPVSELAGAKYPLVPTPTKIDELVVEKLRKLGMVPSNLTSDAEFLRRVSLDMTGTLPTPEEVEQFLADSSSDKRARKIDELLERPSYTAWWTTKLCDFTGNSDDALVNVTPDGNRGRASQDWYNWIHKRVAENTPYDQLVEGIVLGQSRLPGEDYREYCERESKRYHTNSEGDFSDLPTMPHFWARRNFRQTEERAIGFAYSFLGIRIQCAQCHKHPFDQWTQVDFKQFEGFFARVQTANNGRDRDEYNKMIAELGIKDVRGGELRRSITQLLRDDKVVPFPEVYATPPRNGGNNRGGNNNRAVRAAREQIERIESQLASAKADGQEDRVRELNRQLDRAKQQIERLMAAERRQNRGGGASEAKLLGSEVVDLDKLDDARQPLMEWLRDKDNPYFARAFVNRVWSGYFNVGIVNPPDDLSLANPPSNRALLDYLARGFIDSGFDMKWIHREIANSRTYQTSWTPNETNRLDERNFARAIPRRLPAEVAYDALVQATASDEKFADMQTDVAGRAIAIPGAGRRNQRGPGYALEIFGRSIRESNCDCDRSSEASLLQTVFLRNDNELLSMIDARRDGWLADVAGELGARFSPQASNDQPDSRRPQQRRPRNFEQTVRDMRNKIRELREAGKEDEVRRAQREMAQYLARFGGDSDRSDRDRQPAGETAQGEKVATMDTDRIVRQAYLRTLSRYPAEDEMLLARAYVEEADDTINGVRGLLWALLNTKEFIVNH